MALNVRSRVIGDVTVLDLEGRITLGEGSTIFRECIRKLVWEKKSKVVVNLDNVTYIDSSGVGEVFGAFSTVANGGGALKYCSMNLKVRDLFHIIKIYALGMFESEADAIRSFEADVVSCLCPACHCTTIPSPRIERHWPLQHCRICGAISTVSPLPDAEGFVLVERVRFNSYEGEGITVIVGAPIVINVDGRLETFALPALKKAFLMTQWKSFKVLVELNRMTGVDVEGRDTLISLLAEKSNGQAVVSLEGVGPENLSMFPTDPPFYVSKVEAFGALGRVVDLPRWTVQCPVDWDRLRRKAKPESVIE